MLYMYFVGFSGSGMVENIYIDTKSETLSSLLRQLEVFFYIFSVCSAAVLAAILFFSIMGMIYMIFDSFIGLGMVKNIYLETNIFTLSAFLNELE